MSNETRELVAEIGPFKLKSSDWSMLQIQINTFGKSANGCQIFFAITGNEDGGKISADRLIILPIKSLLDLDVIELLAKIKNLIAFGYVRKEESIVPNEQDIALSVLMDKRFGKSIYYIIMNSNFEYEVYRNTPENLYGLLQPVNDEDVQE